MRRASSIVAGCSQTSPEFEGIKTPANCRTDVVVGSQTSPEFEGIKTVKAASMAPSARSQTSPEFEGIKTAFSGWGLFVR